MTGAQATKNAEFARLFDLFERIAARGKRTTAGVAEEEETEEDSFIPDDLAPVLGNLATLLAAGRSTQSATRKRRNTLAGHCASSSSSSKREDDDAMSIAETMAKFPLVKRFPFTFKLMIHKLYDMDEWREKIESVLSVSKAQFKTLSEAQADEVSASKTHTAENAPPGGGKPGLLGLGLPAGLKRGGRTRSQSVNIGSSSASFGVIASPLSRPQQPSDSSVRAVKKRCVGRRKSVSALMMSLDNNTTTASTPLNGWVYDAAVSSVGSNTCNPGPTSAPLEDWKRPTIPIRTRHRSLTRVEARSPGKWTTFRAIDESKSTGWDWSGKLEAGAGLNEAEAMRRRALNVVDVSGPRTSMKRGLTA